MSVVTLPSLINELREVVGVDGVFSAHADLVVYECDGFVIEKNCPDVVVFPRTTQHVADIVRLANKHRMPFVPRGAGTSLAGGCLPVGGGIMIVLTRMKAIEEINIRDRYALVQPGVVNAWLNQTLKGTGFHYAPDPSSQGACTIGGNVATNSGGPHTLKYGVTVNHVLGVEAVLADGRIVQFGGPAEDATGLDLVGAIVGSEGTLADGHESLGPFDARSAGLPHAVGDLRFDRRRHQHYQRNYRRWHHSRGAGNDGSRHSGGR